MLTGEEILCETGVEKIAGAAEVLCLDPSKFVAKEPHDPQSVIDRTNNAGGIAYIAHPHGTWEKFKGVTGYEGLEVWNGEWSEGDGWTLGKWDEFLREETDPKNGFVVGIGNSVFGQDGHEIGRESFNRSLRPPRDARSSRKALSCDELGEES